MRGVGEASRRGIDNVLANWPLILIRIAEQVLTIVVVLATLFAAVMPLVLGGVALTLEDFTNPEVVENLVQGLSPLWILYVFGIVTLAILAGVLIHSFVQAGVIGCYLQGERVAPPRAGVSREAFRAFTPELWWSEARRSGWRFFWLYNIIWGTYSLIILLPLIPAIILLALFSSETAALVVTCGMLILVAIVAIGLGFAVFLWSQVVLIDCVATGSGVFESIARSREVMRGRVWTVVLIGVVFFAISGAVGSVIAGFSIGMDLAGGIPGLGLAFLPVRILLSLLNTAVATLVGSWLLAALVAVLAAPREAHHDLRRV